MIGTNHDIDNSKNFSHRTMSIYREGKNSKKKNDATLDGVEGQEMQSQKLQGSKKWVEHVDHAPETDVAL